MDTKNHLTKSPQNEEKLAAVYIRVSTDEQFRTGLSLKAQESVLKAYTRVMGFKIFKIYKESGKSAKTITGRPILKSMLRDAELGKFNAIFIYRLDRFSRSLKDLIETIERLKEWNIEFISYQDKIETTSASGKLIFHIMSAFAEFERNITGERTKFTMKRSAEKGMIVTRAPFGYKISNKKLIPSDNSYQVEKMFLEFVGSKISLTKLSKKYGLSVNGLKKVLSNESYLGQIKYDGKVYQGIHKPLVSLILFNKVQDKLKQVLKQK